MTRLNRRQFLKGSATLAAGFMIVPRHVLGGPGYIAPSDEITLGIIGCGRQSGGLGKQFGKLADCRIIAACDVDATKLERFVKRDKENQKSYARVRGDGKSSEVQGYRDFREMLNRDDLDAIIVATPDHWHAVISIMGMKAGKDVYCEKPLAQSVKEGRAMVDAAHLYERVVQTGSMQRSWKDFRTACELVRNGYLGEIKEVIVNVGGGPPKPYDLPKQNPGRDIDWDMWCGPSPLLNYNHDLAPPIPEKFWPKWRYYAETGGGMIGDWGAHMFDIAQWGLGMDHSGPVSLTPTGTTDKPEMTMKYANGITMIQKDFGRGNAVRFIGSEGSLDVSRKFLESDINGLVRDADKLEMETRLYKSDNHYADFIQAIKNRSKPICDVETGHRTSSLCNIVNIAYAVNKAVMWDPVKEKFSGSGKANKLRSRKLRGDWKLS
ncbi:MAG: Gfo/Idh/MocA family oxidoreductase [Bacteroidota bacterium]